MSESRDGVDQELPSQAEMEAALSERTLRRQAKLWAGMRAEEFVLDLLLKMGTVDKIKHIEPILEIYREVQSRGERTVSATIEASHPHLSQTFPLLTFCFSYEICRKD